MDQIGQRRHKRDLCGAARDRGHGGTAARSRVCELAGSCLRRGTGQSATSLGIRIIEAGIRGEEDRGLCTQHGPGPAITVSTWNASLEQDHDCDTLQYKY